MADVIVMEPGVYDIDEATYHADPVPEGSLSQSGAKKLLQEGGPALFAWEREYPSAPSAEMELGTAAHKMVLGIGAELVEVKAKDYYTKAAKEARDEARTRGAVPLLTHQMETVRAMAAKLREHERASQLLDRDRGRAEASAFWVDGTYGIWRRSRFDLMPEPDGYRVPVIADYKTTDAGGAAPSKFSKQMANLGYYMQADWYSTAYVAMYGGAISQPPAFVFVAQERTPPYRVACYQLPPPALQLGRAKNEQAMAVFRECTENKEWPGYEPEVQWLDLPYWAYREDY